MAFVPVQIVDPIPGIARFEQPGLDAAIVAAFPELMLELPGLFPVIEPARVAPQIGIAENEGAAARRRLPLL